MWAAAALCLEIYTLFHTHHALKPTCSNVMLIETYSISFICWVRIHLSFGSHIRCGFYHVWSHYKRMLLNMTQARFFWKQCVCLTERVHVLISIICENGPSEEGKYYSSHKHVWWDSEKRLRLSQTSVKALFKSENTLTQSSHSRNIDQF